jgi:hypothetical protein
MSLTPSYVCQIISVILKPFYFWIKILAFFGAPSGGVYYGRKIEYVYEDGIFSQEEKEWIHKQFEIFVMLLLFISPSPNTASDKTLHHIVSRC